MSTTITFRRGTAAPTSGAGLTLGEPAFDTTNRNLYMGLGHGTTAAWVGARISGSSADIAAGLTNWIVNAKAIKDYFSNTVSGITPGDAVTWTQLQTFNAGISASSVSSATVNTDQIYPRSTQPFPLVFGNLEIGDASLGGFQLASDSATYDLRYLALHTAELTQGQTISFPNDSGVVALTKNVVTSVDGVTGAINNVARTNTSNTFTSVQYLTAGLSAAGGVTFTGNVSIGATLTVGGNLIIEGTTTTINSTTISVDDKNIVLGDVLGADDTTADGGGITLKGTGDKNLYWKRLGGSLAADEVANAWNTNQDFNLTSSTGKYFIEAYEVLSKTALGSTVVSSSLTSVGTITSGTWNSNITYVDGGTYT